MGKWQSMETAPKDFVWRRDGCGYGRPILAYPAHGGGVGIVWWWQSIDFEPDRYQGWQGPCGNNFRPTHWMPLPKIPRP